MLVLFTILFSFSDYDDSSSPTLMNGKRVVRVSTRGTALSGSGNRTALCVSIPTTRDAFDLGIAGCSS